MNDPGQPPDVWLTLTEAATRTGHTREAIRQRVRRDTLPHTKGNDGIVRVHVRDLADLPPPDESMYNHGQQENATMVVALNVLVSTVADLRVDLARMRTALDATHAEHLDNHGRAERAEARAVAAATQAALAETRLAVIEAALAEARTPWAVRLIRAWRSRN